jgi:hypothetical protein
MYLNKYTIGIWSVYILDLHAFVMKLYACEDTGDSCWKQPEKHEIT